MWNSLVGVLSNTEEDNIYFTIVPLLQNEILISVQSLYNINIIVNARYK